MLKNLLSQKRTSLNRKNIDELGNGISLLTLQMKCINEFKTLKLEVKHINRFRTLLYFVKKRKKL
jgi:hypothetical protein